MVFVVYLATIYDSKLLVGLADSIAYVPALLSLWLGFLADKTRQKTRWLIGLTTLQGLIFLSVAQLIDIKLYQVVLLVAVLNIVSDTISNCLSMLTMPFFKSNVPDKDLESTNALYQVVGLTVVLAGQPIGVWLLEVTGNDFSSLALLNALAFLGARFSPVFNAMLMRHVPDEQLGQVSAFISFMATIAIPLRSVAFSFLGAYKPALA